MGPLPGINVTPKGYYRVGFDDSAVATFPNIQTWAQDLFNLTTPAGNNALNEDFDLMQSWFGNGVRLTRFFPVYIHLGNVPGARWGPDLASTGVNILASGNAWFSRFLVVAEMTEVFMRDQGLGWYAGSTTRGQAADGGGNEGDNGEGLSRFLARQFLVINGVLPSTMPVNVRTANQWLSTSRENFITGSDEPIIDITSPPAGDLGCTTLFINYLNGQL